jgi:hypothetical protein
VRVTFQWRISTVMTPKFLTYSFNEARVDPNRVLRDGTSLLILLTRVTDADKAAVPMQCHYSINF